LLTNSLPRVKSPAVWGGDQKGGKRGRGPYYSSKSILGRERGGGGCFPFFPGPNGRKIPKEKRGKKGGKELIIFRLLGRGKGGGRGGEDY